MARLAYFRELKRHLFLEREQDKASPVPSGLSTPQYNYLYKKGGVLPNCAALSNGQSSEEAKKTKKRGQSAVVRILKTQLKRSPEYRWKVLLKNAEAEPSLLFAVEPRNFESLHSESGVDLPTCFQEKTGNEQGAQPVEA